MSSVVVIDHFDSYTWSLVHLVAGVTGRLPHVVQWESTELGDLRGFTHVVLSPGPGAPGARSASTLRALLEGQEAPAVLGVCLGMQIIVKAFGGAVERASPAHGRISTISHDGDGVFKGLPPRLDVVRYHSLVAAQVPPPLKVTARTDGLVMGVHHQSEAIVGVQFHPESVLTEFGEQMVRNFLDVSS